MINGDRGMEERHSLGAQFNRLIFAHPCRALFFVAGSVLLHVALYVSLNEWQFAQGGGYQSSILTALDRRLPFIPGFVFIYALLYVVPLAAL